MEQSVLGCSYAVSNGAGVEEWRRMFRRTRNEAKCFPELRNGAGCSY
jgi:hypothetical protein